MDDAHKVILESLRTLFSFEAAIELAILVGSRATNNAGPHSDWDFAIQWVRTDDGMAALAGTETLRRKLAALLEVQENQIDLIDLPTGRLAIRSVVAEQGIPLKGEDTLAWYHFLQRTWRELEEYQREKEHVA